VMSWHRGNMALHKYSNLNRLHLMLMMLADQPDTIELFCKPV
jgi:hypothetical protein